MNISDFDKEFRRKIILQGGDEKTAKTYANSILLFMQYFENRFISPVKIPSIEIENYKLYLIEQKFSPSYINQFVAAAKRFYKIFDQPHKCSKLDYQPNPIKTPNILTYQECVAMCSAKINLKHSAIINLLYYGALRRSEIINLKIEHISKDRRITIVRSKFGKSRVITIPEPVLVLLRKYYIEFKPIIYLFNGEKELAQYSAKSIENIVKNTARICGIYKRVHPHILRSSRATHLLDNGASEGYVSTFLGHEKIDTTHRYYHKLTIKGMQDMFDLIDEKLRVA